MTKAFSELKGAEKLGAIPAFIGLGVVALAIVFGFLLLQVRCVAPGRCYRRRRCAERAAKPGWHLPPPSDRQSARPPSQQLLSFAGSIAHG